MYLHPALGTIYIGYIHRPHILHYALVIGTIANRCSFVFHCVCILCTHNILSVEHINNFLCPQHMFSITHQKFLMTQCTECSY